MSASAAYLLRIAELLAKPGLASLLRAELAEDQRQTAQNIIAGEV